MTPNVLRLLFLLGLALAQVPDFAAAAGEASGDAEAGDPLVAIAWTDFDGDRTTLGELQGKPTILNFWATWCVPCVSELELFKRLHPRLESEGVRLVAVSADALDESRQVRRFVERNELPFEILLGATTDQMEALGLEPVLPGTVVLDAAGRVRARFSRVVDEEDVDRALASIGDEPILAEPSEIARTGGGEPGDGADEGAEEAPPAAAQGAKRTARARRDKGRSQETASRVPS